MRALVIGQGGREHALVRALKHSPSVKEVHALPGSDGMSAEAQCHRDLDWKNTDALLNLIKSKEIDLVVVGPEDPLVSGIADPLREQGVAVVGPSREAAQLEGSKIFCKEFLNEAGIPTARSVVVSSVEATRAAATMFSPPYILKADGLAAGKGVFVCPTLDDLLASAQSIFVDKSLGKAGERALLEEFQPGYEISYLVLTDGERFEPLPLAQDHKRLQDGDVGPNTGGMGVVAPVAIDQSLRERIDEEVLEPTMANFKKRGFVYRGVLFIGLMITSQGPRVLEFNTRFGDPETQAILPLLDGDWGTVFKELADGRLPKLKWKSIASCCVALAAEGYPGTPVKGVVIEGLESADVCDSRYFLHAGTRRETSGQWVTAGGRVLNAIGLGADINEAVANAYQLANQISWPGKQMRLDIGAKLR